MKTKGEEKILQLAQAIRRIAKTSPPGFENEDDGKLWTSSELDRLVEELVMAVDEEYGP